MTRVIPVGADDLFGIAVGAGSVWAVASREGVIWRIDPGRPPIMRTIDVGVGVGFVSFGEGALWAAQLRRRRRVAHRSPHQQGHCPDLRRRSAGDRGGRGLGVGQRRGRDDRGITGGLWMRTGDRRSRRPRRPDRVRPPLQGPGSAGPRALEGAIRYMLEQRRFRAGDFSVGYQSCDVSTPQSGGFEFRKCAANASAFAHAEKLVAVIGPWSSYCGQFQIPILNRAPGGPLAMVSPSATHSGLTRGGPLGGRPDGLSGRAGGVLPGPGVRNFFRVVPREDLQGVAQAMQAKRLGLKRVFVVAERASSWKQIHAGAVPADGNQARARGRRLGGLRSGGEELRPAGVASGQGPARRHLPGWSVVLRRRPRAHGPPRASGAAHPDHGDGPVRPDTRDCSTTSDRPRAGCT